MVEERKKITLMLHSELGNTERKDLFHILDQNTDFSNKIQVYYALLSFTVWCFLSKSKSTISSTAVLGVGSLSLLHPCFLSAHHLFCCSAGFGVSLLYPCFLSAHHLFRCSAGCGISLLHPGFCRWGPHAESMPTSSIFILFHYSLLLLTEDRPEACMSASFAWVLLSSFLFMCFVFERSDTGSTLATWVCWQPRLNK